MNTEMNTEMNTAAYNRGYVAALAMLSKHGCGGAEMKVRVHTLIKIIRKYPDAPWERGYLAGLEDFS